MKRFWHIQLPLFDAITDGSGSGAGNPGAGSGTPAAGTGNTGVSGAQGDGQGAGGQAGTGQSAGTPGAAAAAARQFTYQEDRSDWIPRHRFNEVNQRAQKTQTLEQQLQQATQRIQALAGVTPTTPQSQEEEQVRGAFRQMFPGLAKLTDDKIDKILNLADQSEQIQQTTESYWQNLGTHMVNEASTSVAEALGVDKLTTTQAKRVAREYTAWLNEDLQTARAEGRNPTLIQRHEQRDPSLIKEFVDSFTEDLIKPVQRNAVAANVQRVSQRVPSGRGSQNAATTTKPKIDFTNEQAIEDAAVASFAAHGGAFRR